MVDIWNQMRIIHDKCPIKDSRKLHNNQLAAAVSFIIYVPF